MPRSDHEDWLESFSLNSYRPMVRLASGSDRSFLAKRRTLRIARRYRRTQRVLLREYLRGLSRDFHRLYSIAAVRDRSVELFDGHLEFIFSVWLIEARLLLQAVVPHTIDMRPLLESVGDLAAANRESARPVLRLHVR
jgi:hypothetical protein